MTAKKFIVAIKLPRGKGFYRPQLYAFPTAKSRSSFIHDVKSRSPKVEYATTKMK